MDVIDNTKVLLFWPYAMAMRTKKQTHRAWGERSGRRDPLWSGKARRLPYPQQAFASATFDTRQPDKPERGRRRLAEPPPVGGQPPATVAGVYGGGADASRDPVDQSVVVRIVATASAMGTPASRRTICRLLHQFHVGRRTARKKKTMGHHPRRNAQFENIACSRPSRVPVAV